MSAVDVHIRAGERPGALAIALVSLLAQDPPPRRVSLDAGWLSPETTAVVRVLRASGIPVLPGETSDEPEPGRYLLLLDAGVALGRGAVTRLLTVLRRTGARTVSAGSGCTLLDRAAAPSAAAVTVPTREITRVHPRPPEVADVA